MTRALPLTIDQLRDRCVTDETSGCWIWSRARNKPGGYGIVRSRRVPGNWYAHRLSWELHFGEIPVGVFVCHKCDVPYCVNPSHLFLGSCLENARDKILKGRATPPPMKRLSEEDYEYIRNAPYPRAPIAARFGITENHVSRIRSRKGHYAIYR